MLVNLLYKKNIFTNIFTIIIFIGIGFLNYNLFILSYLEKIGFLLVFLTIIFIFYNDFRNDLLDSTSYPMFIYAVWMMPFIAGLSNYRIAGSLLLITYVSARLLYFESEKNDIYEAFDIGLFTSFAIMVSPPLIFLGISFFVYLLTLRVAEPRIPIIGILGFIVPILIIIQISYLLDYYFLIDFYREQLTPNLFQFQTKHIFLIPVGIIILLSISYQFQIKTKLSGQKKRIYLFTSINLFTILLTYIFFWNNNDTYLSFLAFSIMIIVSRYFGEYKSEITWINDAYIWIYMICLLIFNFYDKIPKLFTLITEVTF